MERLHSRKAPGLRAPYCNLRGKLRAVPCVARVLHSIASDDCGDFVSVRNALERQTYVDDICVGTDLESQALELQSNLITVLSKSGLELKKVGDKYAVDIKRNSS